MRMDKQATACSVLSRTETLLKPPIPSMTRTKPTHPFSLFHALARRTNHTERRAGGGRVLGRRHGGARRLRLRRRDSTAARRAPLRHPNLNDLASDHYCSRAPLRRSLLSLPALALEIGVMADGAGGEGTLQAAGPRLHHEQVRPRSNPPDKPITRIDPDGKKSTMLCFTLPNGATHLIALRLKPS